MLSSDAHQCYMGRVRYVPQRERLIVQVKTPQRIVKLEYCDKRVLISALSARMCPHAGRSGLAWGLFMTSFRLGFFSCA